ncbi:MAG: cobalt ECF transporter T component CbiQ [Chloroflexota bacterium]|nr:MAG: cobalt ECF transporter T component CbiQ [Chloroflexota bacterium]
MVGDCCDAAEMTAGARPGSGLLFRLDPRVKAGLLAVGLVTNLVTASPVTPLLLALSAAAVLFHSGVEMRLVFRRLMLSWYLAVVALATQALLVGTTPALTLGPLIFHAEGLLQGILVASRIVGGTTLVLGLSLTTTTTELLTLATRVRLPAELVEITALVYRYLFLFLEEAGRIKDAQRLRLGHRRWRLAFSSSVGLAGMVLIRSYDRASIVHDAMTLRCYRGGLPMETLPPLRRADLLPGALFLAALAVVYIIGGLPTWLF